MLWAVNPCDCLTIIGQHDEAVTPVQRGCLCRVQVQGPILGDVAAQDPLTEQAPRVPACRCGLQRCARKEQTTHSDSIVSDDAECAKSVALQTAAIHQVPACRQFLPQVPPELGNLVVRKLVLWRA